MNHSDTPVNGSKSHDPDLLNHSLTNGNEKGNGHRDDCDDCLVREKLNQSQDPEGENETVVFSRPEAIWRKTFLVTRVTLGSANLMSLCLKFPLIILIIRMVVELAQAKASETQVTTIEPPYEEEVVQPVSSGDSGSPDDAKSQKRESCLPWQRTDSQPSIDDRCVSVDRWRSPSCRPIVTLFPFPDDRGVHRANRSAGPHVRGNPAGARALCLLLLDE